MCIVDLFIFLFFGLKKSLCFCIMYTVDYLLLLFVLKKLLRLCIMCTVDYYFFAVCVCVCKEFIVALDYFYLFKDIIMVFDHVFSGWLLTAISLCFINDCNHSFGLLVVVSVIFVPGFRLTFRINKTLVL